MRKRKKDDYAVLKSIIGGIGLGACTYLVVLFWMFIWEKLS